MKNILSIIIPTIILIVACGTSFDPNIRDSNAVNNSIDGSRPEKDSINELIISLKKIGFVVDTAYLMRKDVYMAGLIGSSILDSTVNPSKCECVKQVKLYKMHKIGFRHKKSKEYFSYSSGKYETGIYLEVWTFNNIQQVNTCFSVNNVVYNSGEKFPVTRSFVIANNIISVQAENQKRTGLFSEFISAINHYIAKE